MNIPNNNNNSVYNNNNNINMNSNNNLTSPIQTNSKRIPDITNNP